MGIIQGKHAGKAVYLCSYDLPPPYMPTHHSYRILKARGRIRSLSDS
jgi:hypothetical protein